jgi:PAS domain S-box-containing protein
MKTLRPDNNQRLLDEAVNNLPANFGLYKIMDDNTLVPDRYSDEFCAMGGYTQTDDLFRDDAYGGVHPEDAARISQLIREHLPDNKIFNGVYRIISKAGVYFWVSVNFNRFTLGKDHYLYAVYTNIDKLKKQEQQLEDQYNAAQAFLQSVSASYIVARRINLTQNLIEYNGGLQPLPQILNCTNFEEAVLKVLETIPNAAEKQQAREFYDRRQLLHAYEKGTRKLETEHQSLRPDGSVIWVRCTLTMSQRPGSGDIIAFLAISNIDQTKLTGLIMNQLVHKHYDNICCVDSRHDLIKLFLNGSENMEDMHIVSGMPYEKTLREYNVRAVAPADLEACTAFMTLRHILAELEQKERCQASFQFLINGQLRIKQFEFFYIDRENGILAFVRTDFTETYKKQLEQEKKLRAALTAAQQANQAKSEFLSRMSHDIRTPLNGIIGMTYLTQELQLPPEARRNLEQISTSSKFLLSLINDVLDMSKAESGKIVLHPEPYPADEFKNYIEAVIKPLCDKSNQTLRFEMKAFVPDLVPLFDKLAINQVVFNLLSNASKYTPEGGLIIYRVHEKRLPGNRMHMHVAIIDNGIGMSAGFQKILFEPFTQEQRQFKSELRGTGLGMTIVKNMMAAMQGTIAVTSELNKGTTFDLDFDLDCIPVAETKSQKTAVPAGSGADLAVLSGKHVLVCEDHPLNRTIIKALLQKKGLLVTFADNGEEGVKIFANSPLRYFDVVLMDIRMPVLDGYETTKAIRRLERSDAGTLPILGLSANAFAEDITKAKASGMNDYLAKPVEPQLLYTMLLKYLRHVS